MNNRLKKIIFIIMAVLLAGILLIQFITPKSSYVEEAITDEKMIKELDAIAQETMAKYFEVEVSDQPEWQVVAVRNKAKEDSGLTNVISLTAKDEAENKQEGDLEFYGIIMEEDSKEVRGAIYQQVVTGPVLELSDEEVKARAEAFLREKGLVTANETLTIDELKSDEGQPQLRALSMKTEKTAYAVVYNLQADKVMYFEYATMQ